MKNLTRKKILASFNYYFGLSFISNILGLTRLKYENLVFWKNDSRAAKHASSISIFKTFNFKNNQKLETLLLWHWNLTNNWRKY